MATHRLVQPFSADALAEETLRQAVEHVMETGDDVVIDVDQRPIAVMISFEAYGDLQRARDRARRRRLLVDLDREALEGEGQPRDLTEEELEDVAVEIGKQINERITERLYAEAWRKAHGDED